MRGNRPPRVNWKNLSEEACVLFGGLPLAQKVVNSLSSR